MRDERREKNSNRIFLLAALFLFGDAMESLIYFGGSVKALDENGKIGGYLVRFSDDGEQKDLSGEYFTSKTYLGARDGDGADTMFHHGQPLPVKAKLTAATRKEIEAFTEHVFAPVKTKRDTIGIFAETVLDMADEYEKAVFGMVKNGKLGWSSGAVGHLVKKSEGGQITRWPIGEASLTPTPCEPLNRALTVKSLESVKFAAIEDDEADEPETIIPDKPTGLAAKLKQHIADLADDKGRTEGAIFRQMVKEAGISSETLTLILAGQNQPTDANLKAFARILEVEFSTLKATTRRDHLQTIKGMFEDALEAQTPSRWELESVYCRIIKKLAAAASAAQLAGVTFDLQAKVKEATDEYTALLQKHALTQIADWIEAGDDEEFYLKAIIDTEASIKSLASTDLDTHSQLTVSGMREFTSRLRGNHEARVKAGRQISSRNAERLDSWIESLEAVVADAKKLKDESTPKPTEAEVLAAKSKFLRLQARTRQLGVTSNV